MATRRRTDRKRRVWISTGLALTLLATVSSPAWAGGQSSKAEPEANASSTATAISGANATAVGQGGSSNVSVTVKPSQSQTTVQGQNQSQANKQSQRNSQSNVQSYEGSYEGYSGASVNVEGTHFDRYAPPAYAPGLTSAGTGVCLGSVSIGASGPMAGLSFGITKVDRGCERRSGAALLYQMGQQDAALRLLMKDDEIREAMQASGAKASSSPVTPADHTSARTLEPIPDLVLNTPLGQAKAATVAPSQMFAEPTVTAAAPIQGGN